MNRRNIKLPPAVQIIKDNARKTGEPISPGSPKPLVIGKAHKFLWQQDLNLDVEVFKLAPKFGEYYCVFAVNVDTAVPLPKVYVGGGMLEEILKIKKEDAMEDAVGNRLFDRQKEIVNILTNGLSVTKDEKHLILPKGIPGSEVIGGDLAQLGSPKVRSKKRVTMADIEKGFDELSAQTTEMSSHVNKADKQVKLMRLAVLAFDNKAKINYHDDSPKGRWHRGFRKIRYRLLKQKFVAQLNKIGKYGTYEAEDTFETKTAEQMLHK